jgi:hypothetical protein
VNPFTRLLAVLGVAAIALAACGGGGSSTPAAPGSSNNGASSTSHQHGTTQPPAASSRTAVGTATLALTLPKVFTGKNALAVRARNASLSKRNPKYVNPTCNGECDNYIDIFVDGTILQNLDGCGGNDSICVNNTSNAVQNVTIPLYSTSTNNIVAVELDGCGQECEDILAVGESHPPSFSPGTGVNITLTMLMNAYSVGILDMYYQADPETMNGQTYLGLQGACNSGTQAQSQFGLFSADGYGTFVPIAGYGGTSTPSMTAVSDPGSTTTAAQSTISGIYLVSWDSPCDGVTVSATAANPAYAIYSDTYNYDGPYVNGVGTHGYENCWNGGTCPGGPYQGIWNIWNQYSEPYYIVDGINASASVTGSVDILDAPSPGPSPTPTGG